MIKEELEKEAKEYANNLLFVYETDIVQRIVRERVRLALIDVLEQREKKQIQIDAEQIIALQKQNGELTDRVRELEQQIEKMKSQYDYAFNQLCESREIVCLMLSQYKNKKEIDYSTKERGEKLLKQGVYKYD